MSSGVDSDWWRGAVIYQIYPRSFCDSNGDGIGDLAGITRHLDHVASLGVDGLWISPFFASPMRDFGYDVSDYCSVDPRFGSLDDFDALIARAHALGLKVIIDQVWSHTSSEHRWFQQSRMSRDNPRADWYVWADAKADGAPPNNWQAWFGGPAWDWDPQRGQYFFHNFLREMPDLNFHHPDVQQAILDTAQFWLERGCDGFRLDTANYYFHDRALTDNPPRIEGPRRSPVDMQQHLHNVCQPENLAFLGRLRHLLDSHGGRMTVAEISSENDLARMIEYTEGDDRLHTAYSFLLLRDRLDAAYVAALMQPWQAQGSDAWPAWAFSNHDTPRLASRWAGSHAAWPASQRAQQLIALLACLRGTVFLYQGEELGLTQSELPRELVQDPAGVRGWPLHKGRDGCRTPMPWVAAGPGAGFTSGTPWLPVEPAHRPLAVDMQQPSPTSTLNFTRRMLALRRAHPALRLGDFNTRHAEGQVLVFERVHGDDRVHAAFNLGESPASVAIDWPLSTALAVGDAVHRDAALHLPPGSALIAAESPA